MRGEQLPPVQFGYHATRRDIPGDRIVAPAKHRKAKEFQSSSPDDTYFTPVPDGNPVGHEPTTAEDAEGMAWGWLQEMRPGTGRGRVHLTEPDPEQYRDKAATFMGARTTPSQRVISTSWTPTPVTKDGHVEGTLPHINWHQFGAPNWVSHWNASGADITFDSLNNHTAKFPGTEEPPAPARQQTKQTETLF